MPSAAGSTTQVKDAAPKAPLPSCAVTVTMLAPAVVGVPMIVPVGAAIDDPAGRPVAEHDSVCPPVESVALTAADTAVPARPSCGPGLVTVTGWPTWVEVTGSVPVSGKFASKSPTAMP